MKNWHKREDPLAFAVARMEIDFKRPAKIDDALIVRTRFVGSKGARLLFDQSIYRDTSLLCAAKSDSCSNQHGWPTHTTI